MGRDEQGHTGDGPAAVRFMAIAGSRGRTSGRATLPSAETQQVIDVIKSRPALADLTLAEMRAGMASRAEAPDPDVVVEATTAGGVPAEFVVAPNANPARVVLFLHGGGYVLGSPTTHRALAARLSRAAEARVLVLDYRLAPEAPFPAAVQDAVFAYQSLVESGYAPGNIAIAGDSAGGGLAVATVFSARERELPMPACIAMMSPWTDLLGAGDSIYSRQAMDPVVSLGLLNDLAQQYLAGQSAVEPFASPLYGDLAGLPPVIVHVGTAELLYDDSTRFTKKAQEAGVQVVFREWDGQVHVFQNYAGILPEARESIAEIGAFIRDHSTG